MPGFAERQKFPPPSGSFLASASFPRLMHDKWTIWAFKCLLWSKIKLRNSRHFEVSPPFSCREASGQKTGNGARISGYASSFLIHPAGYCYCCQLHTGVGVDGWETLAESGPLQGWDGGGWMGTTDRVERWPFSSVQLVSKPYDSLFLHLLCRLKSTVPAHACDKQQMGRPT